MNVLLDQANALQNALHAESTSPNDALAESIAACAESLIEQGEFARALELVGDASRLEAWGCATPVLVARLGLARVRSLIELARAAEALSEAGRLIQATEHLLPIASSETALLRVYEGAALWNLNRVDDCLGILRGLRLELARRPDSVASSACAFHLSSALNVRGDRKAAREMVLEAWVSARRSGSTYWEAMSALNLSIVEREACHWEASEEWALDAAEAFLRLSNAYQANHARRSRAISLWKRGRLTEALETARLAASDAEARSCHQQLWYSRLIETVVLIHLGQFEAARSTLRTDPTWLRLDHGSRASLLTAEFLGDTQLESGEFVGAGAVYNEVLQSAVATVPRGDVVAELRRRLAECSLQCGDIKGAYRISSEAAEHSQAIGERYEEACTYRTLALAAAALGKPDEAKKHFEHGFAMFDDIETPYEWGKLWVAYGDWLCGAHAGHFRDLNGAHEAYRAAIDHFEHIGAQFKLGEARARLAKLDTLMVAEGAALAPPNRKVRPLRRPRWNVELQRRAQWAFDTFGTITRDRSILEMLEEVATVAKSDLSVLILGESGTGKELVARGVHALSGRTGQFVAVNCSAIPATMLEAEFFGHVAGAFTSAMGDKAGLLEVAHQGSVFMDEIGEMSLDLQAKLLRFLETNELRRIGGTKNVRVDTRVVAATNRDRERLQNGDGFRSDLYYRLAHAVYTLPPLRQRGDDIELLVDHFLDAFCDKYRKRVSLSSAARERLLLNMWPGNVRQLRSVMQKIVVSAPPEHVITPRELPVTETDATPRGLEDELNDQERRRIVEALERTHFVKADAARLLRMSRTSMLAKMKRFGIPG